MTQNKLGVRILGDRLESWREIARYLRRRERTVRRWEETEGLPVHRLTHARRGSVYAFTNELDQWRDSKPHLVYPRGWVWGGVVSALLVVSSIAWWFSRPTSTAARGPNPEAVRLVELAVFAGNAGRTQTETAIRHNEDAVRADPEYAPAWLGLAAGHFVRIWFAEVKADDAVTQARHEVEQALRLDPALGFAWSVLAAIDHFFEWNHAQAETRYRRAIEISPTHAVAHSWLADFLLDMRRFDEARVSYSQAQALSPPWLVRQTLVRVPPGAEPIAFTTNSSEFSSNRSLKIVEYQRALDSEPNHGLGLHFLGRALVAEGEYEQGIAYLRKANDVLGQVPFSLGDLGYALARGGQSGEAEHLRNDLIQRRIDGYFPAFPIAAIELGLGNTESAMDWLERAAEEHNLGFYLPSVDPNFDVVREHPRFIGVMKRANLDRLGP